MSDEEPDRFSGDFDPTDASDPFWDKIDPRIYMRAVSVRVHALEDRFGKLAEDVKDNKATTDAIKTDTTEIVAAFKAWKGALQVVDFLSKLAKPFALIGAALAALAALWVYLAALLPPIHG